MSREVRRVKTVANATAMTVVFAEAERIGAEKGGVIVVRRAPEVEVAEEADSGAKSAQILAVSETDLGIDRAT